MIRPTTVILSTCAGLLVLTACADQAPTQPDASVSSTALSNTWTARAPLPGANPRIGLIAASVSNSAGQSIVYVFGGYECPCGDVPDQASSILAYNVSTNTWGTKRAQFIRSYSNGAGVISGKIYVPGGYDFSAGDGFCCTSFRSTLWMYDPAADRMVRKADMPRHTAEGVSGVIGGKLYVVAGDCDDCPTAEPRRLDRYNPATNTWTVLAPPPHGHAAGTGGVINGKLYVAGGRFGPYLDVYDPATNRWTTLKSLPFAAFRARSAVLNGKLYIVGLADPDRRTFAYNPATNAWNAKARFPFTQNYPFAAVAVQPGGSPRELTVGGVKNDGSANAPSQLYTP